MPTSAPVTNSASFADSSLLVVNAANLITAALSANVGTLDVADTAKLLITGAVDDQTVRVVSGFTGKDNSTSAGWGIADHANGLLMTDSSLLTIEESVYDHTTGSYDLTVRQVASANPHLSWAANVLLTELQTKYGANATDDPNRAVAYLARILNRVIGLGNASAEEQARALVSPHQMATAGATNASGMHSAMAASNATTMRNLSTNLTANAQEGTAVALHEGEVGLNAGNSMKNGVGVWFMPLYKWANVSGVESGTFESGYDSGLGGIAFGADYTLDDAFRVGLALNVGTGYASSTGDLSQTNNNFDCWGLSLYAGYQQDNLGLSFDVGYSGIYSDIMQATNPIMGWGNNEAGVNTDVWTVGLTAQYTIETSALDITPHVGVRYMSVLTHGYDVEGNGGTVAEVGSDHQSVWYFPVGVTLSKDVDMENGWTFTPKVDLGFIAAAGDFDATSTVNTPGLNTSTEYTMQNVDGFAFNGGVGFDIGNENVKIGVNYTLQAGAHETGHMINGTFRYEF